MYYVFEYDFFMQFSSSYVNWKEKKRRKEYKYKRISEINFYRGQKTKTGRKKSKEMKNVKKKSTKRSKKKLKRATSILQMMAVAINPRISTLNANTPFFDFPSWSSLSSFFFLLLFMLLFLISNIFFGKVL